jgi:mRNA interferase MazF
VVLVPYPFADLSGSKIRPALVISQDPQTHEVILAFISSRLPAGAPTPTEFVLRTDHPGFQMTGLERPSLFKMDKISTLQRSLIRRRLGHVPDGLASELNFRLKVALALNG